MMTRIGKMTIATAPTGLGVYYAPRPTLHYFAGCSWRWLFGVQKSPHVRAFAVGPFVVGCTDITRA